MTLGPLEYTVIGFAGNNFDGSIAKEIGRVVENGTIRIVDAVAIIKDAEGDVAVVEIDAKSDERFASIAPLLEGTHGPVHARGPRDARRGHPGRDLARSCSCSSTAGRCDVKEAIQAAGGVLIARSVIPPEILEEASAELEAYAAQLEAGVA